MAIDQNSERLFSLAEIAREIPSINGRRCHPSTLWRWCTKGLGGVKMDYLLIGRRVVSSRESTRRFFEACTQAARQRTTSTVPRSATAASAARTHGRRAAGNRRLAIEQADAAVRARGG